MPSNTFLHLSAEKRRRMLNAAWSEFSERTYADASINQILQNAKIPRGSFYQYFPSGKEELFSLLLQDIAAGFWRKYWRIDAQRSESVLQTLLRLYDEFFFQAAPPSRKTLYRTELLRLNSSLDWKWLFSKDYEALRQGGYKTHREKEAPPEHTAVYRLALNTFFDVCKQSFFSPCDITHHRKDLVIFLQIIAQGSGQPILLTNPLQCEDIKIVNL